ncbi:MAG: PdxA family protein [Holophagaceae bacterium]|jgi:4-hydroxythreonine-4-phosphate dehydrogenase
MSSLPTLAITLGDPCGIGPEILLKALPQLTYQARVVIIGSRAGVELLSKSKNNSQRWLWGTPPFMIGGQYETFGFYLNDPQNASQMHSALWIDPYPLSMNSLQMGIPSRLSGKSSIESLTTATKLMMDHRADALVTLPISKSSVMASQETFTGHTEYLERASGSKYTQMIFMSPNMKVALHTVHMSLKTVTEHMDEESLFNTIQFSVGSFVEMIGTSYLNVAVAALNPHAGEQGAFGKEETIISSAIKRSIKELSENSFHYNKEKFGVSIYSKHKPSKPWTPYPQQEIKIRQKPLRIVGPLSGDSVFRKMYEGDFDLTIAMYHDQGLIPIKLVEPILAVNVTFGLPFVRTSPDHGTGFDIAGLGDADHRNFLEASRLALRLLRRSKGYFE